LDEKGSDSATSGGILAMLNAEGNIYVGGVPDVTLMTAARHSKNYIGCISEVTFNGKVIDFMEESEGGYNVAPCPPV